MRQGEPLSRNQVRRRRPASASRAVVALAAVGLLLASCAGMEVDSSDPPATDEPAPSQDAGHAESSESNANDGSRLTGSGANGNDAPGGRPGKKVNPRTSPVPSTATPSRSVSAGA